MRGVPHLMKKALYIMGTALHVIKQIYFHFNFPTDSGEISK